MPQPHLPPRIASPDPNEGKATLECLRDTNSAPMSLLPHPGLLSTSSELSADISSGTTTYNFLPAESYPMLPTVMGLNDPHALLWAAPGHFPFHSIAQNGTDFQMPLPLSHPGEMAGYIQNPLPYQNNYNTSYAAHYLPSSFPRSQRFQDLTGLPHDVNVRESYPPAAYQIEPQKTHDMMDLSDHETDSQLLQLRNDYENRLYCVSNMKMENNGGYQSPYSDLTRSSTPREETPGHTHNTNPTGDSIIDKELPYAQLIYQALMGAPNHTMILRDIYEWFLIYTDKASSSDTKGWQNSIRHNLSMNGAFEKVDQSPEEPRKGFMWRLTKAALHDGVKSTTRYRSKQPTKRGYRTRLPQPQRQASGSKGGQAARRSARMRQSNRNSEPYASEACMSRSVPSELDPTSMSEMPMPHLPSPYGAGEYDHGHSQEAGNDHFQNPLAGPHPDAFHSIRGYTETPMSQDMPIADTHFMLDPRSTKRLFTSSPSPSTDEPRTPASPGGWNMGGGFSAPCVFDELAYRAYAG